MSEIGRSGILIFVYRLISNTMIQQTIGIFYFIIFKPEMRLETSNIGGECIVRVIPVSYTHLDVYKRQSS